MNLAKLATYCMEVGFHRIVSFQQILKSRTLLKARIWTTAGKEAFMKKLVFA
jgi:hypothetical protein